MNPLKTICIHVQWDESTHIKYKPPAPSFVVFAETSSQTWPCVCVFHVVRDVSAVVDAVALFACMLTPLLSDQDGLDALVYDLDFPALRKNKSIDNFLNRCKWLTPLFFPDVLLLTLICPCLSLVPFVFADPVTYGYKPRLSKEDCFWVTASM